MHLLHLCIWLQLYFMHSFLHFLYIAIASAKSFLLAIWYFEVLLLKIWKALKNTTVLSPLSVVVSEPLSSLVAERLLISHIKKGDSHSAEFWWALLCSLDSNDHVCYPVIYDESECEHIDYKMLSSCQWNITQAQIRNRTCIALNASSDLALLIWILNVKPTGWCNLFSVVLVEGPLFV